MSSKGPHGRTVKSKRWATHRKSELIRCHSTASTVWLTSALWGAESRNSNEHLAPKTETKSRKTQISRITTCKPQTPNLKKYMDTGPATVCERTCNSLGGWARRWRGEPASGLVSEGLSWRRLVCSQQEGSGRVWAGLQTDVGLFQGCG